MNWITTNIRFPEELYMELKLEAAKTRKSVAQIVRERVVRKERSKRSKTEVDTIMTEFIHLAKANARYLKGVSLSKALIEMRYEQ